MMRLAARLRFMFGAFVLAGFIALAAPAHAQQQSPIIDPRRGCSSNPPGGCGIISTK